MFWISVVTACTTVAVENQGTATAAATRAFQTKGLMTKTTAMHVRFESLYITLPSSSKLQREMIKFYVFWKTRTAMTNFWYRLFLEMFAVGAFLA